MYLTHTYYRKWLDICLPNDKRKEPKPKNTAKAKKKNNGNISFERRIFTKIYVENVNLNNLVLVGLFFVW